MSICRFYIIVSTFKIDLFIAYRVNIFRKLLHSDIQACFFCFVFFNISDCTGFLSMQSSFWLIWLTVLLNRAEATASQRLRFRTEDSVSLLL